MVKRLYLHNASNLDNPQFSKNFLISNFTETVSISDIYE